MRTLTEAGQGLVWQNWDDVFIVYQPSSTETHVFNETTALILRCLEREPQSMNDLRDFTEGALGLDAGELGTENFAFAIGRLEELGLVDSLEHALATQ